jgi:hypothetical protein
VDTQPAIVNDFHFDYKLLADQLFSHIKAELRVLVHEQQHNQTTLPKASLSNVHDIVRQAIEDYKEGR